jgi:hypothetical protein
LLKENIIILFLSFEIKKKLGMKNILYLNKKTRVLNFHSLLFLLSLMFISVSGCNSQTTDLQPGKERWAIKTSVYANAKHKKISLLDIIRLPAPVSHFDKKFYEIERISDSVKYKGMYYKEGDMVTTKGFIHLVALERDKNKRDGDYHIQVLPSCKWGDNCLIVEVPYPEFIKNDNALKEQITKARKFVCDVLLKGQHLNTKASALSPAIYVSITGQLFFDGTHLGGNPRGKQHPYLKKPMKSYTCWEIHPVREFKLLKTD